MPSWYLAEQVTGIEATTLIRASRVDLADSALHAPQAGFGDEDFYPDLFDKAAILACRISWNHPLPDGNKRAAWACMVLFVDLNGGKWTEGGPDVDEAVDVMFAVAARDVDEAGLATWLLGFVTGSRSPTEASAAALLVRPCRRMNSRLRGHRSMPRPIPSEGRASWRIARCLTRWRSVVLIAASW